MVPIPSHHNKKKMSAVPVHHFWLPKIPVSLNQQFTCCFLKQIIPELVSGKSAGKSPKAVQQKPRLPVDVSTSSNPSTASMFIFHPSLMPGDRHFQCFLNYSCATRCARHGPC